jgi:hypothetical protein
VEELVLQLSESLRSSSIEAIPVVGELRSPLLLDHVVFERGESPSPFSTSIVEAGVPIAGTIGVVTSIWLSVETVKHAD